MLGCKLLIIIFLSFYIFIQTCVEGKPSNKLDGKTESCLKNCVERFIDTNMLILQVIVIFVLLVVVKSVAHFQRFERKAGEIASSSGGDF